MKLSASDPDVQNLSLYKHPYGVRSNRETDPNLPSRDSISFVELMCKMTDEMLAFDNSDSFFTKIRLRDRIEICKFVFDVGEPKEEIKRTIKINYFQLLPFMKYTLKGKISNWEQKNIAFHETFN